MPVIKDRLFPDDPDGRRVVRVTDDEERAAVFDPQDPEATIAAAAERVSNWGRWGADDVLGTLNLLTPANRVTGAALVRRGDSFDLTQHFNTDGPQKGWLRRVNPVHAMLGTGLDAEAGIPAFPHGIGGADDMITMPLQASTQWDGLGHIFDHGKAYNGRRAGAVVTSEGDNTTGIETTAGRFVGRGVLLDVARHLGQDGELPDGFAITPEHLDATAAAHGVEVTSGDLLLVRTGRLSRARRDISEGRGWGDYAGGESPGLSFTSLDWLRAHDVAAVATDTWGVEVRPSEFAVPTFQPFHQVAIPHLGLFLGEMWDLEALAEDCAADGVHEFLLAAPPLPVTGAVGAPVAPIAIK